MQVNNISFGLKVTDSAYNCFENEFRLSPKATKEFVNLDNLISKYPNDITLDIKGIDNKYIVNLKNANNSDEVIVNSIKTSNLEKLIKKFIKVSY